MTPQAGPFPPGARLGLVGGGQLGRMFVQAANRMGYAVTVLDPDPGAPAVQVAQDHVRAAYDDRDAMERLATTVVAVTAEFENVSAEALAHVEDRVPVRPSSHVFAVAQDRIVEKATLRSLGAPVADYAAIESADDLARAVEWSLLPGILKTATSGYDGLGQRRVANADELRAAWRELGEVRCVLETLVAFEGELSVLGVRGPDGEVRTYEPVWNHHSHHILDVSICPAPVAETTVANARGIVGTILEGLDAVGVVCVEFFLLSDGELVVNEIAPRPHNSGHLTIEAHESSQFDQQVRALCGLPLGSTERRVAAAAMANLLGDLWQPAEPAWDRALDHPATALHLYGKSRPRPGRKMGHLTVTGSSTEEVERVARAQREALQQTASADA